MEVKNQEVPQINQALEEAKLDMTNAEPSAAARPGEGGAAWRQREAQRRPRSRAGLWIKCKRAALVTRMEWWARAIRTSARTSDNSGRPIFLRAQSYGNGTGGANGVRGTVASTGFGNGSGEYRRRRVPATPAGTVKAGGFAARGRR